MVTFFQPFMLLNIAPYGRMGNGSVLPSIARPVPTLIQTHNIWASLMVHVKETLCLLLHLQMVLPSTNARNMKYTLNEEDAFQHVPIRAGKSVVISFLQFTILNFVPWERMESGRVSPLLVKPALTITLILTMWGSMTEYANRTTTQTRSTNACLRHAQ